MSTTLTSLVECRQLWLLPASRLCPSTSTSASCPGSTRSCLYITLHSLARYGGATWFAWQGVASWLGTTLTPLVLTRVVH
ncbi:hypothetical protein LZ32DRAFT_610034 [Colletotrichum eremochloae]|nr:hypothetical protein LZ32DRAFT_610034 [Colletotrichum eremochloae]